MTFCVDELGRTSVFAAALRLGRDPVARSLGSGELLEFAIDQRPGEYHGMMGIRGAFVCHRYHPANLSEDRLVLLPLLGIQQAR